MAQTNQQESAARAGARQLIRPLRDFIHAEASGGLVLVTATVVALIWANSPWKAAYSDLWETELFLRVAGLHLDLDLHGWINDGLMTIFFFVVGLEIKRELVDGELREPRQAAMPAIAALGGMAVPAAIYLVLNAGGDGSTGWGIPVATDIAMAVGVLSLLGSRVAPSLKLFLLALAIVDDIGAILLIAVFYSSDLSGLALLAALGMVALVVLLRVSGVQRVPVYVVVGVALWFALHESGVHATLAGVVLGLLTPTTPMRRRHNVESEEMSVAELDDGFARLDAPARHSVSVVEWLEHRLLPWSTFMVLPLFALGNAGIPISLDSLGDAAASRVTYGVVLGLLVGKVVGITLATWLAVRLGVGVLPSRATWGGIVGVGALAGIGFTVSIFVTNLAFDSGEQRDLAKVGILVASLTAAVLGSIVLAKLGRRRVETTAPTPEYL